MVGQKQTPVARAVAGRRCPRRSGGWRAPRSCAGPSTPSSRSSAVGVRPCTARHARSRPSARTSGRAAGRRGVSAQSTTAGICSTGHRAHRVERRADEYAAVARRRCCSASTRSAQRVDRAVAEPLLRPVASGAPSDAGAEIAGVEQGEPDAGVRGRVDQGLAHRVRVGVRPAAGVVVQVVELADRGDAGQRHLGVHRRGPAPGSGRGQPSGGARTSARARSRTMPRSRWVRAAQRPVEGVRVGVGQARDHQAAQPRAIRLRAAAGLDRGDPAVGRR